MVLQYDTPSKIMQELLLQSLNERIFPKKKKSVFLYIGNHLMPCVKPIINLFTFRDNKNYYKANHNI